MSLHWENKRKRTESTVSAISLGDALKKDTGGSIANMHVAGVHYGKWAAYLGSQPHDIARQTKIGEGEYYRVEKLCESPIERKILPWLIYEDYGLGPQVARTYNCKDDQPPFRAPVVIIPQFAILRFRVDFMIIRQREEGRVPVMCAVECDGFNFHNRSRDQQRDGHLAMLGVRTVRASGESITADPRSVSGRVAEACMSGE